MGWGKIVNFWERFKGIVSCFEKECFWGFEKVRVLVLF